MSTESSERVRQLGNRVIALVGTRTARSSLLIFAGSLVSAAMAFVVAYFATRTLGPSDYGRLATSNAVVVIMVGLTDFGVSTALVRFTSGHLAEKSRVAPYFQGAFRLELVVGLLILVATLFTPQIANFLGGPDMRLPIYIGLISSFFLSIGAYTNAILQTYQRFKVMALLNATFSALRAVLFVALVVTSALTLANALIASLVVAVLTLIVGLVVIPKTGIRAPWADQRLALREMYGFGKWLIVSYSLNAVLSRLDIVLLSHFRPAAEVGHYAAALQLASFMPLLLSSLTTVLIPKVSVLPDGEVGAYLRKTLFGAAVVAVVLAPIVLLAGPLIGIVFGDKYVDAVLPFQLIMLSFILTLFINPPSLLFYKWNKPVVLTYMNVTTGTTMVLLMWLLIQAFGATGAASALVINTAFAGCVFTFLLRHQLRKIERVAQ